MKVGFDSKDLKRGRHLVINTEFLPDAILLWAFARHSNRVHGPPLRRIPQDSGNRYQANGLVFATWPANLQILQDRAEQLVEATSFVFSEFCPEAFESKKARLPAVDEQSKRVGKHGWPRAWILCGGSRSRAEFGGNEIDGVGGVVKCHGASTTLRLDHFHEGKLCRGVLVGDGKRTVAARGERKPGNGIEAVGVHSLAYGDSAQDFARVIVDQGHEFIVATNLQSRAIGSSGKAAKDPLSRRLFLTRK